MMETGKLVKGGLLLGILIIILVLGVFSGDSIEKESDPIKVGVILPLSGFANYYGNESQNALSLALDDLEERFPKIDFKLSYEDSFYNPKGAVDAYKKLQSTSNLDAVIVGGSHIATPIRPLVEEDGVLEIAIWAGAPSYSDTHNLNFRVTLLADDQLPILLEYMSRNDLRRLGILFAENEFSVAFKDSLEKFASQYGVEVVSSEGFANADRDFRTQLTEIRSKNPDTIFFVGASTQLSVALKQAEELRLDTQFLSTLIAEDPAVIENSGEAAEGLVYNYNFDSEAPGSLAFTRDYRERYGRNPTFYSAEAYVGMELIAQAVRGCKYAKDVKCWRDYLDNANDIKTLLGPANIDNRGDLKTGEVFLKTVKDGEFVRLEESN